MKYILKFNESNTFETDISKLLIQYLYDWYNNDTNEMYDDLQFYIQQNNKNQFLSQILHNDTKKELGNFFIQNYIFGDKNSVLWELLSLGFNSKMSELIQKNCL